MNFSTYSLTYRKLYIKSIAFLHIIEALFVADVASIFLWYVSKTLLVIIIKSLAVVSVFYTLFTARFNKILTRTFPLLKIFLLWTLFIMVRGVLIGKTPPNVSNNSIIAIFTHLIGYQLSDLAYFIPFISLMTIDIKCLYYLRDIGIKICILGLIIVFLNRNSIFVGYYEFTFMKSVSGSDPVTLRDIASHILIGKDLIIFLLLNSLYLKSTSKLVLLIWIILYASLQVLGGGRGGSITAFMYIGAFLLLSFSYPISCIKNCKSNNFEHSNRLMLLLLLFIGIFSLYYLANYTKSFDLLMNRFFIDKKKFILKDSSRGGLVEAMVKDFNGDVLSWFFGRGANGSYYVNLPRPLAYNNRRHLMEWGYLYYVLKGGIPYLIMFVYLISHAAYVGFYKSKNLLCKSAACMCLFNLICLATTKIPSITIDFVMTWFCFNILENNQIRELSDETIYKCFNTPMI